jgi:hypothetical protein
MTRPACAVCGSPVNTAGESRCWRHRRPQTAGRARRLSGRRDPVTEAVWAAVRARDGRCAAARAGLPDGRPCEGPTELDHILNGGLSLRGPSTPENLVALCRWHHRYKTEHAAVCRRLLVAYLANLSLRRPGAGVE